MFRKSLCVGEVIIGSPGWKYLFHYFENCDVTTIIDCEMPAIWRESKRVCIVIKAYRTPRLRMRWTPKMQSRRIREGYEPSVRTPTHILDVRNRGWVCRDTSPVRHTKNLNRSIVRF